MKLGRAGVTLASLAVTAAAFHALQTFVRPGKKEPEVLPKTLEQLLREKDGE